MLIGELARRSGVSRKALRLYEAVGILPAPRRTASGYRQYGPEAVGIVTFVCRARGLGFSLAEIGRLVTVRRAGRLPCAEVRALVSSKSAELERRRREIGAMQAALRRLLQVRNRRAGQTSVCPWIEAVYGVEKRRSPCKP